MTTIEEAQKTAKRLEEKQSRLLRLMHGIQSGIAMLMGVDGAGTEPKHLRVGVNNAMVEHAALVRILISKGVFTDEEYLDALVSETAKELEQYETKLSQHYERTITLG